MNTEVRKFWQAEIRAVSGKKIIGSIPYHSLSEDLGGFREVILPGAFTRSLSSNTNIVSLWSHDHQKPLGSTKGGTLKLNDTAKSLRIELTPGNNTWGQDALEAVRRGDVQGFSFGMQIVKENFNSDGIRELVEVDLFEVSPCVFPAYPESSASVRTKPKTSFYKENKMTRNTQDFWDGFDSNDDYLRAVIRAGSKDVDPRLLVRAGTGLAESPASDGGFLATESLIDNLLMGDGASILKPLCDGYRVVSGPGIFFPATDETTRVSGSELGGLTTEWLSENKGMTYVNPRLRGLSLSLKKLGGLVPCTDELFESGGNLAGKYVSNIGRRSLAYGIDRAIFRGTGTGMPLGILNAPATITIPKEAGQSADTVVTENIKKMFSRLPAASMGRAVWLVNPEVFTQNFTVAVGVAGSVSKLLTSDANGQLRMMGCRVIPFEHCSAIGDRGDIALCDLSQYVWIDREIRQNVSIHVLYDTDESLFRFIYWVDGQPAWSKAVTPAYGSNDASPFVVLADRA